MKTLIDHNAERRNQYSVDPNKPCKNGIECPACKSELWDSNPMMTLTSMPPQKDIICKECGYRGYRMA